VTELAVLQAVRLKGRVRPADLAATRPSGAISESAPCSGFSVTTMTRSGAPFHGATGEGKTVSPAAFPQPSDAALAGASIVTKRNKTVAAAANRLARSILATFLERAPEPHSALPTGAGLQDS